MKRLMVSLAGLVFLLSVGCHAQVPQTTWQVNVSWTAPPVCSTATPCTFPVSRAAIASGSSCPSTTGTFYALVGTSTAQATTLVDSNVTPGAIYCYIAQTTQAGSTGPPSQPSAAVTVPSVPAAPGAPTATPAAETQVAGLELHEKNDCRVETAMNARPLPIGF